MQCFFQMVAQIYKFEKENGGEKSMKVIFYVNS